MTVKVENKEYEIVENANDNVETVYGENDTLQAFPILAVKGIGRSIEDGQEYEIVWYLDADEESELSSDASDWVADWSTADQANLI